MKSVPEILPDSNVHGKGNLGWIVKVRRMEELHKFTGLFFKTKFTDNHFYLKLADCLHLEIVAVACLLVVVSVLETLGLVSVSLQFWLLIGLGLCLVCLFVFPKENLLRSHHVLVSISRLKAQNSCSRANFYYQRVSVSDPSISKFFKKSRVLYTKVHGIQTIFRWATPLYVLLCVLPCVRVCVCPFWSKFSLSVPPNYAFSIYLLFII